MIRPGKDKGIASPIPLGLATLATTTFLMGYGTIFEVRAAWFPYFVQAIMFGGLVQLLAGMWAFAYGDTLAATTFSFVGAFYGWLGLLNAGLAMQHAGTIGLFPYSSGMVLVVSGFVIFYLSIAAFYESMVFSATLGLFWIALELMAIFAFTGAYGIGGVGGGFAIAAGVLGAYGSFADVFNITKLEETLPLWEPEDIRTRAEQDEEQRIRRLHPTPAITNGTDARRFDRGELRPER